MFPRRETSADDEPSTSFLQEDTDEFPRRRRRRRHPPHLVAAAAGLGAFLMARLIMSRIRSSATQRRNEEEQIRQVENVSYVLSEPLISPDITGARVEYVLNSRGRRLFRRIWLAEADRPRGVILLIHGYSWHSAYFAKLAEKLNNLNFFDVISYDLEGHGHSEGMRGYIHRFDHLVDDAEVMMADIRQQYGDAIPCFLYAESLGTMIASSLARRPTMRNYIKGIVLASSMLHVGEAASPRDKGFTGMLLKIVAPFRNQKERDGNDVALLANFDQGFGDPSMADMARRDPLVILTRPLLRTAYEMYQGSVRNAARVHEVQQPLLILHGTEDKRSPPSDSEELCELAGSEEKTLTLLEGMHHQLLQETPEKTEEVVEIISTWLFSKSLEFDF